MRATVPALLVMSTCALPERSDPSAPVKVQVDLPQVEPVDIEVGDAVIHLRVDPTDRPLPVAEFEEWVRRSAATVTAYYGRFPVPELDIAVFVRGDGGIDSGLHMDGRRIKVWVGRDTAAADLDDDWVMVHEMLHTGFPDLHKRHCWMQEGISTYLEPIVRARSEQMSERWVWSRFVDSMHHGLPAPGDRGLDRTHTWGRTYWGGALFWLLVDLELRARTGDRVTLRDALVGIVNAGGDGRVDWSSTRVVRLGDRVTGTTVFSETYAAMARQPRPVDLPRLWSDLGVVIRPDGSIDFDDTAPLAHRRRAMVLGAGAEPGGGAPAFAPP